MAIKLEYGVKKNWMGDPCFPKEFAWDGVKCRNTSGNIARIVSLDLSSSNLRGVISNNFTLLTALENLNLSGNQLNGPIPDSLCKNNAGQFIFSYGSDGNICNKTIGPSPSSKRTAVIAISVVVPVLVVAVLVLACLIWRVKRKPNKPVSTYDPPRVPDLKDSTAIRTDHLDHLQKNENRRFTYEELMKFTNNFQRFIGQGGFGKVYYGCLENSSEVAVKILSELSSQVLDQFLAEVQSLTKVHHRNLVSLIGYCWEKNHLALVYEYMSRGNLFDHLRGKNDIDDTFNWATRVRVALDAAQGMLQTKGER